MAKDYQALYDADLALIADATANGFMNARAIRDGLGYDKPGPTGRYYSSIQTADKAIRGAGEEFVILIPDGEMYYIDGERVTISKALRIGVYPDVFERVKAYKDAVDAKRLHDDWQRNMDDALAARAEYGAKTDLMDWDAYIEGLGPEPPNPDEDVLVQTSLKREDRRARAADAEVRKVDDRRAKILTAVASCPADKLNKKGLPRIPWIRRTTGIADVNKADREWALAEIAGES